jgi:16S rRNA (uracil1498-N3)-methyltransferase
MAKYRFYIPGLLAVGGIYALDDAQARHSMQVLRLQANDAVEICNGDGILAIGTIINEGKKKCDVIINAVEQVEPSNFNIHIAISPLKNVSRLEWFLEKASEIGVSQITPLICKRTEKENLRTDRLEQIIISALLQSKQMFKPVLNAPIKIETFLVNTKPANNHFLIAHCEADTKENITQYRHQNSTILIGPEGDFTTDEITAANQAGYKNVTLGNNRLRTETAGIVAATTLII